MAMASGLDEKRASALLDGLEDLQMVPVIETIEHLNSILTEGLTNQEYTSLCATLGNEIATCYGLEHSISKPDCGDDPSVFLIDANGLVAELGCLNPILNQQESLSTSFLARLALLEFFTVELAAARINAATSSGPCADNMAVEESGTDRSAVVHTIAKKLTIQQTQTSTAEGFVAGVKDVVSSAVGKLGSDYISSPLLTETLTETQLSTLAKACTTFSSDYSVRRQLLLKRLDVTIQSFKWSERAKTQKSKVDADYEPLRKSLSQNAKFTPQDVIFAPRDLLNVMKTSNNAVRAHTQTVINKITIGSVPDRGGRPSQGRAVTEMPRFKQRAVSNPQPQRQVGSGRGRGSGRSGKRRHQGGWSGGNNKRGNSHKGSGWGSRSVNDALGN